MKKQIFILLLSTFMITGLVYSAHAQMMMGGFSNLATDWNSVVEHTASEEKEGKDVWQKIQAKELSCAALDENQQFDALGEYFMGTMLGESHAAMNAMMMQMHGVEGEKQIHIAMGKRLSGCDTSAVIPAVSGGWMPMMNMMSGGWSSPSGYSSPNSMMNVGYGFGFFGWIFMLLWWIFVIVGIIASMRWLMRFKGGGRE